jgi:ribosomal protein S18 acetylase RimI-like enzyme
MKIEQFTIDMYHEVYQLWEKTGLSLGKSDTKEEIQRALNHCQDLFIVGKTEDKIVAVVMGAFDGRRGYVHHLAVDPDYHRLGYGRKIMIELHNRFTEKNIVKVHLFIEVDNEGVIEFYKKIGWFSRDDLVMMSYIPN